LISHEYTIVQNTPKFYTVSNGRYRDTISKVSIKNGEVKVELISKEGREMMGRKITNEQLAAECRVYGTDENACKAIAEKYDLSPSTIKTYIYDWGLNKASEAKGNAAGKKKKSAAENAKQARMLRTTELTGKNKVYTLSDNVLIISSMKSKTESDFINGSISERICINFDELDNFQAEFNEVKALIGAQDDSNTD
jgi:hypothetical protein